MGGTFQEASLPASLGREASEFIHKWRQSALSERAAAQPHFRDLCDLLGQPDPSSDATGRDYAFEKSVTKLGGGQGFADVWKRGHFAWEYKSYDSIGRLIDYGSLEVQAVYVSGNVRTPFEHYMEDPHARHDMDWRKQRNSPRPDYLSSSRKRLAPQLIFKGGILNTRNRKMAVALNRGFYHTLPALEEVDKSEADMAWFVYDLVLDPAQNRYQLQSYKTVYTKFETALLRITRSEAGEEASFLGKLQTELNRKLNNANAPETITPDPGF